MKHTELVEFSFHFKKEKFQWYALEVLKRRVFCLEKQTSLIRLIRRTKKKSPTASSKCVKNLCIKEFKEQRNTKPCGKVRAWKNLC